MLYRNKIDVEREMRVAVSNIDRDLIKMCTEQLAHTSHYVHTFFNILLQHNNYVLHAIFRCNLKLVTFNLITAPRVLISF